MSMQITGKRPSPEITCTYGTHINRKERFSFQIFKTHRLSMGVKARTRLGLRQRFADNTLPSSAAIKRQLDFVIYLLEQQDFFSDDRLALVLGGTSTHVLPTHTRDIIRVIVLDSLGLRYTRAKVLKFWCKNINIRGESSTSARQRLQRVCNSARRGRRKYMREVSTPNFLAKAR